MSAASLTLGIINWNDFPPELQDMISARVKANRIARLRMERRLVFRYAEGPTPEAQLFVTLRDMIMGWGWVHGPPVGYDNAQLVHTILRQIFDRNFRLDDDDVNVTAAEWAQVVLRIVSVHSISGPRENLLLEGENMHFIELVSDPVPGQGQHNIRVYLPSYGAAQPNRPMGWIDYTGFLSWQTFTEPMRRLLRRNGNPNPAMQANQYLVRLCV